MIKSFRHKGLETLFRTGSKAGIQPAHGPKLRRILGVLDQARGPLQMNLPGFKLHPLGGELEGFWSVSVTGNWRVIFRFDGEETSSVDYLDYH